MSQIIEERRMLIGPRPQSVEDSPHAVRPRDIESEELVVPEQLSFCSDYGNR
jgi:hypothetical protein